MKHKHAELIHAWADGAQIQMLVALNGKKKWMDNENPIFVETEEYRIKPEEKKPVVRYLWAIRQKTGPHIEWLMLQTFSTEQEFEERMGLIRYETKKLEWSRTEFTE